MQPGHLEEVHFYTVSKLSADWSSDHVYTHHDLRWTKQVKSTQNVVLHAFETKNFTFDHFVMLCTVESVRNTKNIKPIYGHKFNMSY